MASPVELLGDFARFFPFPTFNRVQEAVIPTLWNTDANVIVAAPTGCGKTELLEVAILRLFRRIVPQSGARSDSPPTGRTAPRAVYICPIKALGYEKHEQWSRKFPFLRIVIETGDHDYDNGDRTSAILEADVILTTPERWDSITRRWREATVLSIVASVALILLDEIHTVSETRGAALEAVVSRMKAIKEAMHGPSGTASSQLDPSASRLSVTEEDFTGNHTVRFVAISATLPNIEDVARWLHVDRQYVFSFPSSARPVPLKIHVVAFPGTSRNPYAFDKFLSFKLLSVLQMYSEGKPVLVFCASRKEAVSSATHLYKDIHDIATRDGDCELLQPSKDAAALAEQASDKQLRVLLRYGIAFHHAAMCFADRQLVERMFRSMYIAAVCTTTTLAMGVNLPARLVVVKGTTFFKSSSRDDLPLSEVAQMCGRAGRPGLDTLGVAVVLTTEDKAMQYEPLQRDTYTATTVESQLHEHMVEHANAEVALGTIRSVAMGIEWLKTTFFWIRLQMNPSRYGLHFDTRAEELRFDPEHYAETLMMGILQALQVEQCVRIEEHGDMTTPRPLAPSYGDKEDGGDAGGPSPSMGAATLSKAAVVHTTRIGRAMARFYVEFGTVCTLRSILGPRVKATEAAPWGAADGAASDACDDVATEAVEVEAAGCADGGSREAVGEVPSASTASGRCTTARPISVSEVLEALCHAAEFSEHRLRLGDKARLNRLNKVVRFPLRGGAKGGREVREDWHKIFILVQTQLAHGITLDDFSLRNDVLRMWGCVPRLAKFLHELSLFTASFSCVKATMHLLRCVERRMWWDDPLPLRQLTGVGDVVARALRSGGVCSFREVLSTPPRKLEVLCGKAPPFGADLQARCRGIPLLDMDVTEQHTPRPDRSVAREETVIAITGPRPAPPVGTCASVPQPELPFVLLVGNPETDEIVLLRRFKVGGDAGGVAEVRRSAELHMSTNPDRTAVGYFRIPRARLARSLTVGGAMAPLRALLFCERYHGMDCSVTIGVGGPGTSNAGDGGGTEPGDPVTRASTKRKRSDDISKSARSSDEETKRAGQVGPNAVAVGDAVHGSKGSEFEALMRDLRWIEHGSPDRAGGTEKEAADPTAAVTTPAVGVTKQNAKPEPVTRSTAEGLADTSSELHPHPWSCVDLGDSGRKISASESENCIPLRAASQAALSRAQDDAHERRELFLRQKAACIAELATRTARSASQGSNAAQPPEPPGRNTASLVPVGPVGTQPRNTDSGGQLGRRTFPWNDVQRSVELLCPARGLSSNDAPWESSLELPQPGSVGDPTKPIRRLTSPLPRRPLFAPVEGVRDPHDSPPWCAAAQQTWPTDLPAPRDGMRYIDPLPPYPPTASILRVPSWGGGSMRPWVESSEGALHCHVGPAPYLDLLTPPRPSTVAARSRYAFSLNVGSGSPSSHRPVGSRHGRRAGTGGTSVVREQYAHSLMGSSTAATGRLLPGPCAGQVPPLPPPEYHEGAAFARDRTWPWSATRDFEGAPAGYGHDGERTAAPFRTFPYVRPQPRATFGAGTILASLPPAIAASQGAVGGCFCLPPDSRVFPARARPETPRVVRPAEDGYQPPWNLLDTDRTSPPCSRGAPPSELGYPPRGVPEGWRGNVLFGHGWGA